MSAILPMFAEKEMTAEQVQKLSLIFRQVRDVVKHSVDDITELAENALTVFSENESTNTAKLLLSPQENELLTKKELARRWKVSERTISNLQAEGLPPVPFGKSIRFDYEEVLTWAKEKGTKNYRKNKLRVVR